MKFTAIILSAGRGLRMKQQKALLEWNGQSFLSHIAKSIKDSKKFEKIIVVTGSDFEPVIAEADRLGIDSVYNGNFETGVMSSLQLGIDFVKTDAAVIFLVDQPMITSDLITDFLNSYVKQKYLYSLARIEVNGKPNHPCLIKKEHFEEILTQFWNDQDADFLFKKYPEKTFRFRPEDVSSLKDINTPEDLKELQNLQGN